MAGESEGQTAAVPLSAPTDVERVTFRYERWRALTAGILETAGGTFLLLIAIKYYNAGTVEKALLASGPNPGLLLTPLVVYWVSSAGWRATAAASWIALAGAAAFLAAAFVPHVHVFVVGSVLGMACLTSIIPLLTQMYQDNYPAERRGRLFTNAVIIRIIAAAVFSYIAGEVLKLNLGLFQWLMLIFAVSMAAASYCLRRCPSSPLHGGAEARPFSGMRFVREDTVFRLTLIAWTFMGLGNLMIYQLRVEYMANPEHGEPFTALTVAVITGVVPNVARLIVSPVWGRLFDRMNFFTLRIALNVGLALGALAFFLGRDLWGMVLGALIYGVANAGGEVAWSLWVTKIAPAKHVAEYMSVHTFFTGVRGVMAPVIAYSLLHHVTFPTLSYICTGLIVAGSLVLLPEVLSARATQPGAALVREVSE
jgi:MFS family permease